jgi:F-type H+-transporting ATPase subunit epsilon
MANFDFEILSPDGKLFIGQASSATFPTMAGVITVLPNHTNLVTVLKKGDIDFLTNEGAKKVSIDGGFLEISDHKVNVVVEFNMPSAQESRKAIDQAKRTANELKEKVKKGNVDISVIEAHLKSQIESLRSGGIKTKGRR